MRALTVAMAFVAMTASGGVVSAFADDGVKGDSERPRMDFAQRAPLELYSPGLYAPGEGKVLPKWGSSARLLNPEPFAEPVQKGFLPPVVAKE